MISSCARNISVYSRTHYRVPADLPVVYMTVTTAGVGRIRDISVTGCIVYGALDVLPGSRVALRVRFTHDQECLEVESAIVRWTDGTRHGLEFHNISALSKRRLYVSLLKQAAISIQGSAALT